MKVRFLITAKEPNIITEKGVRVFVMERLLNSPFEKGSVTNLDDKTVEVRIEGDEEQIKQFKEELRQALAVKLGNPKAQLSETEQTPNTELPQLVKSSQALLIGQLSKGIDVQLHILETLKAMTQNFKEEFRAMRQDFKTDITGFREDSNTNFKNLPKEIAKAIKQN